MLSLTDNPIFVRRLRASLVWATCIVLVFLDFVFDLPGPIGFMCTLVLANEWMRTLPGMPVLQLCVLAASLAAGFIHQSETETWWTRLVVVGITGAVFLTFLHPRYRTARASDAESPNGPALPPTGTAYFGSSFESESRLQDLIEDGDISGPTRSMPHVPMKVRLIDSGVFPPDVANQIATLIAEATNLELGCDRCVTEGWMTAFQSEYVKKGYERKLRVGRYTLVDKLGGGAMGVVYRAWDRDRFEHVALKLFRDRRNNLMLIRREMTVIQELAHPNIVTALDVGESDGQHFIAMEIVDGETLLELVRRDGPIEESRAIDYAMQISQALIQAHDRNILHRDVKPGNVMLSPDGICKLMDLGLSRPPELLREYDSIHIASTSIYGTIGFVSPEQANLTDAVDFRSDIYGIGSTLFYLLTAKSHVRGNSAVEKLKNLTVLQDFHTARELGVSDRVAVVLEKMLAYSPEDRYQSVDELAGALQELLSGHGQRFGETEVPVLVVENTDCEHLVSKELTARENRSLRISSASSVSLAIEAIQKHQAASLVPVVVVVDLSPLDETLLQLIELSSGAVGVVVLATDDSPKTRQLVMDAGAIGYLLKHDVSGRELEQEIFAARSRMSQVTSSV